MVLREIKFVDQLVRLECNAIYARQATGCAPI